VEPASARSGEAGAGARRDGPEVQALQRGQVGPRGRQRADEAQAAQAQLRHAAAAAVYVRPPREGVVVARGPGPRRQYRGALVGGGRLAGEAMQTLQPATAAGAHTRNVLLHLTTLLCSGQSRARAQADGGEHAVPMEKHGLRAHVSIAQAGHLCLCVTEAQ